MTKPIKRKTELIWMAWSPDSGWLPQAASVDRAVCLEMVKKLRFSWRVKVIRAQVGPPPRAASQ